ncbi:MAG: hypothetical protein ACK4TP_15785, partial [Hyphomicrobium sp.]
MEQGKSTSELQGAAAGASLEGAGDSISADICVIGAEPGGLAVAMAAAAFGRSVVLIERHQLGGEPLGYGILAQRARAAAANRAHALRTAGVFG